MKMSQRIRYIKVDDGTLQSRRNFTITNGTEVVVELNPSTMKYRIVTSATREEVASGGDTINLSVLKIEAKQKLADLGVEFEQENRVRETTVTSHAG